jgi:hypothetical protein
MKKEAKELVTRIYHTIKWSIPHPHLEELFAGAKDAAKILCEKMREEFPDRKEKYDLLEEEINRLDFKIVNP